MLFSVCRVTGLPEAPTDFFVEELAPAVENTGVGLCSIKLFHSLQAGQHPNHLTLLCAQLEHEKLIDCFAIGVFYQ
jgi:hypothetical protein